MTVRCDGYLPDCVDVGVPVGGRVVAGRFGGPRQPRRRPRGGSVLAAGVSRWCRRVDSRMKTASAIVYLHLFLLFHRAFSSVVALGASIICNKIPGLAPKQRTICQSHPDAMVAVGEGAKAGLHECRYQFRKSRWNCSLVSDSPLGHVYAIASREAGSFYSFRSAGIAYAVTQACSLGNLIGCGCDKSKTEGRSDSGGAWKWGGCSADINYGLRFSRILLDSREIEEDERSLMNLHNNRAGRKALKDSVSAQCKCHGVSGSCTMKTCWITLPKFRLVGDRLFARYLTGRQVEPLRGQRAMKPKFLVLKNSKQRRKPPMRDIAFLDSSPSYCDFDPLTESLGTKGRACNRTSVGTDSCDSMCCGRGYNTHQDNRTWKCNCRFHWCCSVTCHMCSEKLEAFTCK